jgi:hypothetical protein
MVIKRLLFKKDIFKDVADYNTQVDENNQAAVQPDVASYVQLFRCPCKANHEICLEIMTVCSRGPLMLMLLN